MKERVRKIFESEASAIKQIPVNDSFENVVVVIYRHIHKKKGKLITTGMGKAGQIAHNIATTFSSTGSPAIVITPGWGQSNFAGYIPDAQYIQVPICRGQSLELFCEREDPLPIALHTGDDPTALRPLVQTTVQPANVGLAVVRPFTHPVVMVEQGRIDLGVIIHEGRFTYRSYGLNEVADLGVWWEELTGLPLPLGGIIARRSLPPDTITDFSTALRESILKASAEQGNTDTPLYNFIRQHAQEMETEVINGHIDLYVNEYSLSLAGDGNRAFEKLFSLAEGISL